MKSITDILTWVIGIAATVLAVYFFFWGYRAAPKPELLEDWQYKKYLWLSIGMAAVAFICALVFFVRRVNKEEEIHITQ